MGSDLIPFLPRLRSHVPQLPLAALSDVPGLKAAALHKLCAQMSRHQAALEGCLRALGAAADGLAAAVAPLAELAAQEAARPVLGGGPVFTLLPLSTITAMLERIRSGHEGELGAKAVSVAGFRLQATEARQRAAEAAGGGGFRLPKPAEAALEAFLRVHITAWMLDAGVDEAAAEADLAALSQDANSC